MFNAFRKFFGKRVDDQIDSAHDLTTSTATAPFVPPAPARSEAQSRVRVELPSRSVGVSAVASDSTISIPLRSVIGRLPAELMARVRQMDVGEAEVFIPLQKVLTQLSQGAVRISYGELRQSSPPGTFSPENDRDRVMVDLPLHEVLARVNPALMARRPVQKHIEVPAEVAGPFGGQTRITISTPTKPAASPRPAPASDDQIFKRATTPATQPTAQSAPQSTPPVYSPIAPGPVPPIRQAPLPPSVVNRSNGPAMPPKPVFAPEEQIFRRANSAAAPVPPANSEPMPEEQMFKRMPMAPAPALISPVTPIAPAHEPQASIPFGRPSVPEVAPVSLRNISPPSLTTPSPVALPTPDAEPEPIRFNPSFTPAPPTPPAAPAPQPAAPRETIFLTIALSELSEAWPEPVRQEIAALGLYGASTSLPHGMIETAMKQGKIVFPWKLIRSWIKPPAPASHVSALDATMLELPLKVVAPAFLAGMRAGRTQRKISVDANIPDLFSGTTSAEAFVAPSRATPPPPAPTRGFTPVPAFSPLPPVAPVAPVPPPAAPAPAPAPAPAATSHPDTNYYVWKDKAESAEEEVAPVVKKGPSPGTSFLQRYATPNEIVGKAAALNGVGGALIALPDGLLVASKIPAEMNADTLAAFLPQIFGRVSQSTRELRMGDLNNLNFTVGQIPWKIFRVGAIYFAAFGIPGQALPTAQLAGIAADLDRKAK